MKDVVKFELGKIAINEPKILSLTLFLADENRMRGMDGNKIKWEVNYEEAFAYCVPILKVSNYELIFNEEGRYLIDWNEETRMFLSNSNVKKLAKNSREAIIQNIPLTKAEIVAYWENKNKAADDPRREKPN